MTKTTQKQAKTKKTTTARKPTSKQPAKNPHSLIAPNSKVKIVIAWPEAQKTYQTVLRRLASKTKAAGFRQGKTPLNIAEDIIGRGKLLEKTLEELLPQAYQEAVTKAKKKPITQPDFRPLKLTLGEDWEIEAQFAELPEVKLGKYQAEVKKAKKEAEKQLKEIEKERKKQKKASAQAKKGIKTKPNQPKIPAKPTAEQEKQVRLQHIFKGLVTKIKPTIPEILLQQEARAEIQNLAKNLAQVNLKIEDYLKKRQISADQLTQEVAVSTLSRLQLDFVLGAIAKEQKFQASDQAVNQQLEAVKDKNLKKQLTQNPIYLERVKASLIKQKVVDYLLNL